MYSDFTYLYNVSVTMRPMLHLTGQGTAAADSPRFLVTGGCGQIGAELIPLLRERYLVCCSHGQTLP